MIISGRIDIKLQKPEKMISGQFIKKSGNLARKLST